MNDDDIRDVGDAFSDDVDAPERLDREQEFDQISLDPDQVDLEFGQGAGEQVSERESVQARQSGWQPPEPTGVRIVDDAVAMLAELDELPTTEHVAYYESVHRHLQDALADLDGA